MSSPVYWSVVLLGIHNTFNERNVMGGRELSNEPRKNTLEFRVHLVTVAESRNFNLLGLLDIGGAKVLHFVPF